MNKLKIGRMSVEQGGRVFVIAEIGLNHNGSVDTALKMIAAARECGADAVKFQAFVTEKFISRQSPYFSLFKRTQLTPQDFERLQKECQALGILFFSTAFDFDSIEVLAGLDVPLFKIASCDLTNTPLIKRVAAKGKPVLISCGMGTPDEIKNAIAAVHDSGNDNVGIFHCVANYPALPEQMNLRTIPWMHETMGVPVGLSDHTLDNQAALVAASLGACMVERHFTLDKNAEGPDHQLSTNPEELRSLVKSLRLVEKCLGAPCSHPVEAPDHINGMRRSVCAARDIARGTVLTENDLSIIRPGTGIPPGDYEKVIGCTLTKDVKEGIQLKWEELKNG